MTLNNTFVVPESSLQVPDGTAAPVTPVSVAKLPLVEVEIENHPTHGTFVAEVPEELAYDRERLAQYIDDQDLDRELGIPNKPVTVEKDEVGRLKTWENNSSTGKRGDRWFMFNAFEGEKNIGYGHFVTQEERRTGKIKIGDKEVDFRKGLTDEQIEQLLIQDTKKAKHIAMASLNKVGLADDAAKVEALTSLIFNVGDGAWDKSKAKKHLEAGQIEDFLFEAFDEKIGFVKAGGEIVRGLVNRRAEEAELFQTGETRHDQSFTEMISSALKSLAPLNDDTPSEESVAAVTEAQRVLSQVTLPRKPVDSPFSSPPRKPEPPSKGTIEAINDFNVLPTALTSFAESLMKGLLNETIGTDFGEVTNSEFTVAPGDRRALQGMFEHLKAQGRTSFNEKDWDTLLGTRMAATDGKGPSSFDRILNAMKDPVANMAMTIGAGQFKKDERGWFIEDVYDFNEGKLGREAQRNVEKVGLFAAIQDLFNNEKLNTYTKFRVLGFILHPQRKGRTTKIYLEGFDLAEVDGDASP